MAISGGDGSIILTTKIDESGLTKGLSGLKSGVAKFGKAFSVAGAAGVAAFAGITKAAIDSYAEYEQLKGGVETLFKDSAAQLMKYADEAYKTAGMSANKYMEGVTSFSASMIASVGGDTAKAAELSNKAMISISDNANKMGTDIESIIMTYQSLARGNVGMLDNLKLGYGGTKAELERLIEDAEQYKKSMGEIVDYDVSNFADITQAIQAIQEKLGIAGATAEEASTTISGSISSMKAAGENLLTGIVESNEEVPKLMDNFSESVVTVFENIAPAARKVLKNLPKVVSTLGKEIIEEIPLMFGDMLPEVIDGVLLLVETIVKTISRNATKIGTGMVEVLQIITTSVAELIPVMVQAGADIVLGIAKGISGSMPVLSAAVIAIGTVFAALKIATFVSGIVSGFQAIMGVLTAYQTAVAASQTASILLASTLTPLQLVIGVLTNKVDLAIAAQVLWNAVINANHIMLAVTAIGLLVGAVAGVTFAYDSYLEKNSEIVIATQNIANAAQEAVDKTNELKDSLTQLTDSAEANILELEAEAYANETLVEELYDLAGQAEITADEKERMKIIVDDLNNSVDNLGLALDEETGKLNLTEEAVKDVIAQKLELAKANAVQDLYTEKLKEQYKAEADAIKIAKDMKEAQDELNEIRSAGVVVQGNMHDANGKTIIYTQEQYDAMDNLTKAISDYETALTDSESAVQTSNEEMQNIATAAGVDLPESFTNAQQSSKGFYDALNEYASTASSEAESKGNDLGQGYANGVNDMKPQAYIAGYNLATEALLGIADGQKSASPAKESKWLGGYFGDGYALGIKGKAKLIGTAAKDVVEVALTQTKNSIKNAKKVISSALRELITDSRSEVQRVNDEMNEEMLDSEKFYISERERLEREKEEKEYQDKLNAARDEEERQKIINDRNLKIQEKADEEYLDELEKTADRERKIHEARLKDIKTTQEKIVDAYETAAEDIFDSIENLQDKESNLADKLFGYGSVMEEVKELEDKFSGVHVAFKKEGGRYELTNLDTSTTALNQYGELMAKLKTREGMAEGLFDVIRNMSFEDSFGYARKLMQLGDREFADYIESWEKKQETSKRITEQLFGEDGTVSPKKVLSDVTAEADVLIDYFGVLQDVKNRAELPEGFFEALRDMGLDEGLEYANALLELSDEDFAKYIEAWKQKQEISQTISKELYRDEAEQLATEVETKFDKVTQEFFGVGETAADQFESGFMAQLASVIVNIKDTISSAFSGISMGVKPSYGTEGVTIDVPALARGSVLPGGNPFLAIVNDQPRGQTNIEAPLDTIVDAMNISLNARGGGEVIREEHYHLNETELMTVLHKLVKGGARLQGTSLIGGTY